jgi:amidase
VEGLRVGGAACWTWDDHAVTAARDSPPTPDRIARDAEGTLAELDAIGSAELVHTRKCTPRELVAAAIARIEKANPRLNAVVHDRFEQALAEADAVDPSAPFAGVPFLYKDIGGFEAGERATLGMRLLRDRDMLAPFGSNYADQIRAAGFIPLGRTNTPELGLCATTEPQAFGATRNPWDLSRTPGGSSGGAAAAVAGGLVPVAHGNDGGGSIRIPAAACGLVGLKPSRGRISWGPVIGEADAGLAVEGVLTRTVRDSAALLDVLAGTFPGEPYAAPAAGRAWREEVGADPGRLRIGILEQPPAEARPADPACAEAVRRCAATLEELGHAVEDSAPPSIGDWSFAAGWVDWWAVTAAAATIAAIEVVVGARIGADDVEPMTWALTERGRATSAVEFVQRRDELGALARIAGAWWGERFDLLLTPTVQAPAPALGELMEGDPATLLERQLRWFPLTPFANVSGQPAISVPVDSGAGTLPVGVQLIAGLGREDVLIRIAAQLEQAMPWRGVAPAFAHDRIPGPDRHPG